MPLSDFRVVESVGKGSFASVYKVMRKSDNNVYALKRVKIGKMSKREIADALNEIRFLASIRHKNVVGFLEAFLENNETELCIIMEYCGCGDLAQKVERYKRRRQYIDEDVIWRYFIQSLKALKYLHEKGICHRDLKTANSFIAADGSVKVGDMNVSKTMNKGNLKTQIGTPYYMSPEIWQNRPYDSSSDMWSLGCMIYELCALRPPFQGDSFPSLKRAVTCGRYSSLPSKYSPALHRAVANLLRLNPRSRPTADDMLKSPEFSSKLHLDASDEAASDVISQQGKASFPNLLQTIKVPHNLRKLNHALPKACYPDVRPNTPTAWTVAEQYKNVKENVDSKAKLNANECGDENNSDAASVDKESESVDSASRKPAKVKAVERRRQRHERKGTKANPHAHPSAAAAYHVNPPHMPRQPSKAKVNKPPVPPEYAVPSGRGRPIPGHNRQGRPTRLW